MVVKNMRRRKHTTSIPCRCAISLVGDKSVYVVFHHQLQSTCVGRTLNLHPAVVCILRCDTVNGVGHSLEEDFVSNQLAPPPVQLLTIHAPSHGGCGAGSRTRKGNKLGLHLCAKFLRVQYTG